MIEFGMGCMFGAFVAFVCLALVMAGDDSRW